MMQHVTRHHSPEARSPPDEASAQGNWCERLGGDVEAFSVICWSWKPLQKHTFAL